MAARAPEHWRPRSRRDRNRSLREQRCCAAASAHSSRLVMRRSSKRLPAGERLLRVPARAQADRGPNLSRRPRYMRYSISTPPNTATTSPAAVIGAESKKAMKQLLVEIQDGHSPRNSSRPELGEKDFLPSARPRPSIRRDRRQATARANAVPRSGDSGGSAKTGKETVSYNKSAFKEPRRPNCIVASSSVCLWERAYCLFEIGMDRQSFRFRRRRVDRS